MPIQLNKSKEELRKFGRNTTDYTKLSIVGELDIIPRPGLGSVTFAGNIKSETDPSDFYRVTVQFFNVKFYKNDQDNTVKVEGAGDTPFMMIPTIRQSNAALKCRCPSFRFEFEKQLYDKDSLIGNWRRYKRKTPPSVRPAKPKNPNPIGHDFKNPDNYLGFCKHVWSLMNVLKDRGLVRERPR
jgi:hypothetical protein